MTNENALNPEYANCPACVANRWHTDEDNLRHPLSGHGYSPETGWTHPSLGDKRPGT